MSREIKYRKWEMASRKHSENCLIDCSGKTYLKSDKDFPYLTLIESNGVVIEQYTGLKDKNGTEIYEGDILSFKGGNFDEEYRELTGQVVWGRFNAGEYAANVECWTLENKSVYNLPLSSINAGGVQYSRGTETTENTLVVIGNIHENPALFTKTL